MYFIRKDNGTQSQFNLFVPRVLLGLTQTEFARLKPIEAFATTILAHRSFEIEFLETQIVNFWRELYGKLTSARACSRLFQLALDEGRLHSTWLYALGPR